MFCVCAADEIIYANVQHFFYVVCRFNADLKCCSLKRQRAEVVILIQHVLL